MASRSRAEVGSRDANFGGQDNIALENEWLEDQFPFGRVSLWFEKCCVLDVGLAGWQPNYFVKTLGGMSSQFSDNGKGVISRVKHLLSSR